MDTLTFVSAILGSLAWPIAVAIMVIILKKPLVGLFERITSISHNQTRIDLVPLVESKATAESAGALSDEPETDHLGRDSIAASPRAAIIEAWIEVEIAASNALQSIDSSARRRSPGQTIHQLSRSDLIDPSLESLIKEMMSLRNQAAHLPDLNISSEDARSYVETAGQVSATLRERVAAFSH